MDELADVLLRQARGDARALIKLGDDGDVDDAIVGFHGQQAVEKSIKAVLAAHAVDFPFVHDIGHLLRLLWEAGVNPPPAADQTIELSPWEAELRYGEVVVDELDRPGLRSLVGDVLDWAEQERDRARAAA